VAYYRDGGMEGGESLVRRREKAFLSKGLNPKRQR
jgi:hypothetical protein